MEFSSTGLNCYFKPDQAPSYEELFGSSKSTNRIEPEKLDALFMQDTTSDKSVVKRLEEMQVSKIEEEPKGNVFSMKNCLKRKLEPVYADGIWPPSAKKMREMTFKEKCPNEMPLPCSSDSKCGRVSYCCSMEDITMDYETADFENMDLEFSNDDSLNFLSVDYNSMTLESGNDESVELSRSTSTENFGALSSGAEV